MIPLQNPAAAAEYFARKLAFSTGPVEVSHSLASGEQLGLIDVREEKDFAEGHLPGAVNLPESQWPHTKGVLRRDAVNIVYCYTATCHLAARAARLFALQGYQVMEMDGGFEAWQNNNLQIESGHPKPPSPPQLTPTDP